MPYALCPMHVGYLMLLRKAIDVWLLRLRRYPSCQFLGYIVFPCLRLVCRFFVRPESSIIQANPLLT